MMINKPYFMSNKDWYYFDEIECTYKLTEQAPKKAQESYHEYYKQLEDDRV